LKSTDTRNASCEVYGSNIGNYSATGKRGNRPPINRQLYNGLFGKYIKLKKSLHVYT